MRRPVRSGKRWCSHSWGAAVTLEEIQRETALDPKMQRLIPLIVTGNQNAVKADSELTPYGQIFPELSVAHAVVLRGRQICIPESLQDGIIDICHEAHLGIVKSKQLLRNKVWLPGIDKKMERKVAGCIPCQAATKSHHRDPLQMTPMPDYPWQQIAVDFAGPFPTAEYLLVATDEASRYPEVEVIKSTAAKKVKPALEKLFVAHGLPEEIKSDNGPPFNGAEFHQFSDEKGFIHRRVTPLWPESNGQAENLVKTLNKSTVTSHLDGKDWRTEIYVLLRQYRATPHPSTGRTPYSLMYGREIRNKLPSLPTTAIPEEVHAKDEAMKKKNKEYADRRRNTHQHNLTQGDLLLIRQRKLNKLTLACDPEPFKIQDVKGTQILVERASDGNNSKETPPTWRKFQVMRNRSLPPHQKNSQMVITQMRTRIQTHRRTSRSSSQRLLRNTLTLEPNLDEASNNQFGWKTMLSVKPISYR